MNKFYRIVVLAASTFFICLFITLLVSYTNQTTDSGIVMGQKSDKNREIVGREPLDEYDGIQMSGEEVLAFIAEFQDYFDIGVSTPNFIKYYTKTNPFIKNQVNNLDYIDPKVYFTCELDRDDFDNVNGARFWQDGCNKLVKGAKATQYVMFTESGEFTIPEGVTSITLNACASGGLGADSGKAGEYIIDYKVNQLKENDIVRCTITYGGNTDISITRGNSILYSAILQAGVVSSSVPSHTLDRVNGFILGGDNANGKDGPPGFYNTINANVANLSESKYNCKGGKGGYGGAFGYGGGGGQGASIDTASFSNTGDYSLPVLVGALGGHNVGVLNTTNASAIIGRGGKGTVGWDRWGSYRNINLNGSDGGNGTLVSGGTGGVSYGLTTEGYKLNDFKPNQNDLYWFSVACGAGGGGGAGGYGAGGGQGGRGARDADIYFLYYLNDNSGYVLTTYPVEGANLIEMYPGIAIEPGEDGAPSPGMVYIVCN